MGSDNDFSKLKIININKTNIKLNDGDYIFHSPELLVKDDKKVI